jgi:hypothetical protein
VKIEIHPHAAQRMAERGITASEISETIETGESFEAKHGRKGFRKDFPCDRTWRGRRYATKQVEAFTASEGDSCIVVTVMAKYY